MLFRRPPGTSLNGIPIPTEWTPELVRALLTWQKRNPDDGLHSHAMLVVVHGMRSDLTPRGVERTLYGFVGVDNRAVPVEMGLTRQPLAMWRESRVRMREHYREKYGPGGARLAVYGTVYWAGRATASTGDVEDRRPGLSGMLYLPPKRYAALVREARTGIDSKTRSALLGLTLAQTGRHEPEELMPTLQQDAFLSFSVIHYTLTTYAAFGSSVWQNRFYRRALRDDVW